MGSSACPHFDFSFLSITAGDDILVLQSRRSARGRQDVVCVSILVSCFNGVSLRHFRFLAQ